MVTLPLEDSGITVHNACSPVSEPQFRRSKVPGNNVVLSGERVRVPSDPTILNKTNKTYGIQ